MSTQINLSKKIAIKDEGTLKTSDVNSIDFTGTGVTATNSGNDVTVNIPGVVSGSHVLTKPVSGRTYSIRTDCNTATSSLATTANFIVLSPFIPANTLTVLNFIINVVISTAGANARILVYSDLNGAPNSKLFESSINLDCSTLGTRISTPATPFTFTAGTTYWLGLYSSAAVTFSAVNPTQLIPISTSTALFTVAHSTMLAAATFSVGSAPNPLTTATLNTAGLNMFLIHLTAV